MRRERIEVRLPTAQKESWEAFRKEIGVTNSDLIRRAVDFYIASWRAEQQINVYTGTGITTRGSSNFTWSYPSSGGSPSP